MACRADGVGSYKRIELKKYTSINKCFTRAKSAPAKHASTRRVRSALETRSVPFARIAHPEAARLQQVATLPFYSTFMKN